MDNCVGALHLGRGQRGCPQGFCRPHVGRWGIPVCIVGGRSDTRTAHMAFATRREAVSGGKPSGFPRFCTVIHGNMGGFPQAGRGAGASPQVPATGLSLVLGGAVPHSSYLLGLCRLWINPVSMTKGWSRCRGRGHGHPPAALGVVAPVRRSHTAVHRRARVSGDCCARVPML